MSLRVWLRWFLPMIFLALSACHAPLKLASITPPARNDRPRVYLQSITSGIDNFRLNAHDAYAQDNVKRVEGRLWVLGYDLVPESDVSSVTNNEVLSFYQLQANNWEAARSLGKALYADYVLIIDRSNDANATTLDAFLVNTLTGKVYQGGYRLTQTADRLADAAAFGRWKIAVINKMFSNEAKEEMILTAKAAGSATFVERLAALDPVNKSLAVISQETKADNKNAALAGSNLFAAVNEANPPGIHDVQVFDEEGHEVGNTSQSSKVYIKGSAADDSGLPALLVNGAKVKIDAKGQFLASVVLKPGSNQIKLEAYDIHNNRSEQTIIVRRENPELPSAGTDVSAVPDFSALPRPDDFAVVIGIEEYRSIPRAEFAAADAELIRMYLKALGIPERNIAYLVNSQATLSDIKKNIESWLPNRVTAKSRVVVYFSGHGSPDMTQGNAYLVPYDGDPEYLADTAYPVNRLFEKLGKLPSREVTVMLDSCFSGTGGRSVLMQGGRPLVMTATLPKMPDNVALMAAASKSQISMTSKEKRHGLFTYYLFKALKQGKQTLAEIMEFVKPRVEDEARQQNVQQTPTLLPEASPLIKNFSLL